MPTQTTDLFFLEDLEDAGATSGLAESDREALQAVADWIPSFVIRPHEDLADWKSFLDDEEWLGLWARRFGESGVRGLAQELRRLPWRE